MSITFTNIQAGNFRATSDLNVIANQSIPLTQIRTRVVAGTASPVLTLPTVAEAAGLTFTIWVTSITSGTVVVQDQDESEDWTNLALTAADDGCVLYSDGLKWNVLLSVETP